MAGLAVACILASRKASHKAPAPEAAQSRRAWPSSIALSATCAALAILPDADLLFRDAHRGPTHSVGAVILILIVAAGVTRWVTGRIIWPVTIAYALAYGSHLLLDWLAIDRLRAPFGIELFWPFNDGWYISGLNWFPPTERRQFLSAASLLTNLTAIIHECVKVGPFLAAAWMIRRRRTRQALVRAQYL
jgi:membrane-bound metal-dependent hydrolase YbcI (DUF457 family)